MPIYEFSCEEHGTFEALFPRVVGVEYLACPTCDVPAPRIYSLPTMRPDANWHFGEQVVGHGYLNSRSKIARANKANGNVEIGGRNEWEAVKKTAEEAQRQKEVAHNESSRRHFLRVAAGSGIIDSDGKPTADAFKKQSDEPIKTTKDSRLGK